jgi:hypothetical protein
VGACSEKRWPRTAANDSTAENRKKKGPAVVDTGKKAKTVQRAGQRRQTTTPRQMQRADGQPLRIRAPRFLSSLTSSCPRTAHCPATVKRCMRAMDDCGIAHRVSSWSYHSLCSVLEFSVALFAKKKEFSTALHRGGPVNHNEDGAQC